LFSDFDKERLKGLLRIDSVQGEAKEGKPFGDGPYTCLVAALQMMADSGLTVKNVDGYCGYGEIGEGKLFGILAHLDVVPVGKGWHYPPFGAVEENGRIYARGALDDKGPFMATLVALERALREGKPKKRIRFIVGCNEESGWGCMKRYCETEEVPALGFSPDADFPVIYCEKGIVFHEFRYPLPPEIADLTAGERPNMVPDEARCTFVDGTEWTEKGLAAHGSTPYKGENALIKLLSKMKEQFTFAREMYRLCADFEGKEVGLDFADEDSGRLTINLGTCRREKNELVFAVDIRYPVSVQAERITEILQKQVTASVTRTNDQKPLFVEKEHPLVQKLSEAYREVTGEDAEPIAIGGGTYARMLPCGVAFGPCFPNGTAGIHCADEYLDLEEWDKTIEIYYRAIQKLCF